MEGTVWNELHSLGYVTSNPNVKHLVTPIGLEQLRILEDMRNKELTLIISIIAIVLSVFSFIKSMGWI